jgi:xanthosine utilization system XapX-like protein
MSATARGNPRAAACQVVAATAVVPSAPTDADAEGATVEDLPQQLAENPQAAVTIATTEHFNLQTDRAATIGEANGRASIFLGSVSAGLVALGFAAQGGNSLATMRAFALVLFPVLAFLGLSTFERVLQVSIEDLALSIRINRIRRFYLEAAPGLRGWLAPAPAADTFQAAMRSLGLKPRPGQILLTVAGTISIVNSALAGVWVGMAVSLLPGPAWVPVVVGLVAMLGAAFGQHRYQTRRRQAAPAPFAHEAGGTDAADAAPTGPA